VSFTPPLAGLVSEEEGAAALRRLADRYERLGLDRMPPELDGVVLQLARSRIRKAACAWGWDFGARLPSIGLQGRAWLVRQRGAAILGVDARPSEQQREGDPQGEQRMVEVGTGVGSGVGVGATLVGTSARNTSVRPEPFMSDVNSTKAPSDDGSC
jgi:hypothetical protein